MAATRPPRSDRRCAVRSCAGEIAVGRVAPMSATRNSPLLATRKYPTTCCCARVHWGGCWARCARANHRDRLTGWPLMGDGKVCRPAEGLQHAVVLQTPPRTGGCRVVAIKQRTWTNGIAGMPMCVSRPLLLDGAMVWKRTSASKESQEKPQSPKKYHVRTHQVSWRRSA